MLRCLQSSFLIFNSFHPGLIFQSPLLACCDDGRPADSSLSFIGYTTSRKRATEDKLASSSIASNKQANRETRKRNVVECMMTQPHSSSSLLHSFQSLIRLLRPLKKDRKYTYFFAQMHHFTRRIWKNGSSSPPPIEGYETTEGYENRQDWCDYPTDVSFSSCVCK